MKISKSDAVALFLALGLKRAGSWNLNRIGSKLGKIKDMIDEDVELEGDEAKTLKAVLASTPKVVEGVATTKAVYRVAAERNVEMPIVREVYRVLYRGKSPAKAVRDLMTRSAKAER